jgi:hypothetical protein
MKVGKDAVVIGNVSPRVEVGDGSVVIGATDAHGNTILNQSMAVGRGAQAGYGSTAIGAFAGAGGSLNADLQQFAELVTQQTNDAIVTAFEEFKAQLRQPAPSKSAVLKAWDAVRAAGSVNGAHTLLVKITSGLTTLFGG